TVGEYRLLRGAWADRLPLIDEDIARLEALYAGHENVAAPAGNIAAAIRLALSHPRRVRVTGRHERPAPFTPGDPVTLTFAPDESPRAVRLVYRRVTQAERYTT